MRHSPSPCCTICPRWSGVSSSLPVSHAENTTRFRRRTIGKRRKSKTAVLGAVQWVQSLPCVRGGGYVCAAKKNIYSGHTVRIHRPPRQQRTPRPCVAQRPCVWSRWVASACSTPGQLSRRRARGLVRLACPCPSPRQCPSCSPQEWVGDRTRASGKLRVLARVRSHTVPAGLDLLPDPGRWIRKESINHFSPSEEALQQSAPSQATYPGVFKKAVPCCRRCSS